MIIAIIEQKNGAVVRKIVGHDRLVSVLAYQQLDQLYQASRLLVNCFQPSMKLQSKSIKGEREHRIYDEAKTPLQRVLLSGVLPDEIQRECQEFAESLDPLRLVQHVEALQRAVWRCAEGGTGRTLVRFALSACLSDTALSSQREVSNVLVQPSPEHAEFRDWSRSMNDPFLGEWERIHAYVCARSMASAREVLREWQRRFPERFVEAHLSILQRRLREIRASLVAPQAERGGDQRESATAPSTSSGAPPAQEDTSSLANAPALIVPDPASALSSLPSAPAKQCPPVPNALTSEARALLSKEDKEDQPVFVVPEASAVGHGDMLLPSTITIDHAMSLFLQAEHTRDWEPKTREWHETALGQLRRYTASRKILLLPSLTRNELREWFTFLRTEILTTGAFRVQSTISTYARSAHAWCAWLVEQKYLAQSPFARMPFPQGKKRLPRIIEQEVFERMLAACHATQTKRATMTSATARNRAIIWVLWDAGLLVSEMCALNLDDVDLTQGALHVKGTGPKGRTLPLTPEVQQALTMYLKQYRLQAGKCGASDPLFLSEQRTRLTKNGFTQLVVDPISVSQ